VSDPDLPDKRDLPHFSEGVFQTGYPDKPTGLPDKPDKPLVKVSKLEVQEMHYWTTKKPIVKD